MVLGSTDDGYNAVDTAGSGQWGGASYQLAVTNIGGTPEVEPQELSALTGDEYYLPIKNSPNLNNGDPYLTTGDYLIINSAIGSGTHPEFVQITEVMRANTAPYYLKVKRQPFGPFGAILTTHADTNAIYKVNVQFDATWLEVGVDGSGTQDNFYLSEFGGNLTNDDYVIVSRDDSTGTFEYVKVVSPLSEEIQKFRINNGQDCDDPAGDVFVVNSVTGDTVIEGSLTINNSLVISGGCGTLSNISFTGNSTVNSKEITNVSVTSPDKTLSDIQIGDVVKVVTNEASLQELFDTTIVAVDTTNNKIYLDKPMAGGGTGTGITFQAHRNEKFELTNGNSVPTFSVDTCTGTTHVGSHYGRIEIEFGENGGYTNNISDTDDIVTAFNNGEIEYAYGFWFDPQMLSDGGPSTTIRTNVTGSSNQIQIPVQSLGVGSGKFAIGDYVFVGDATAASTGTGTFIVGLINNVVEGNNPTIVIYLLIVKAPRALFLKQWQQVVLF